MDKHIRRFHRNRAGHDYVVGDIHGHFSKLRAQLHDLGFNPATDRLFSTGDLVDRGPESAQALDWTTKPWFHAVRGNHEDMAIRWPDGTVDPGVYLANGGAWNTNNPVNVQLEIAAALRSLPLAIEVDTACGPVGIVHAECPYASWTSLSEAMAAGQLTPHARETLMWARGRIRRGDKTPIQGLRALVVGHTTLEHHSVLGNVHYIDTGAWSAGQDRPFTILDLGTLEIVPPHSP